MRAMLLAAAAALGLAGAAGAATVTFTTLPEWSGPSVHVEDGVTVQGDLDVASFGRPGAAHLDDSGTSFASSLSFTTGSRFYARSLRILTVGFDYFICPGRESCLPEQGRNSRYRNVGLYGFLDGALVAQSQLSMDAVRGTFLFSDTFREIDRLVVRALGPWDDSKQAGRNYECDYPCGHFDVDDVTLLPVGSPTFAPVPVPASAGLLGLALVGLGALRRRRARAA